ncbi:hypothetical protein N0V93_007768 [Gnomoniopsis smithogilvyi]|uniref:Zn(2)-C6 fungal-type domain-containing protein n=1 Tax=Gnomoniopsis smithogilvyi TaxID=1191159 RepID=A0A9W8YLP6_9PEZI|nr:hypothetical protein N0V93_007768 [Gnomoniopsis smithogilvyi]
MDDFLLDAPKSTYRCHSIEDLQLQLATLRESKVTHTKAHHISATFEFGYTLVFNVPEPEKDVADPDPSHDAASASATPEAAPSGAVERAKREIRAQDILMNQPNDDPVLQRAVAKLLITSLGHVDGSSWSVREMSRSSTGWTFHYICKNSTQAWMRQNAKNAKVLVGESSGKDGQDPVNLARPAFDCRGSVTIAFVRNSRMITVKLEHTPMHKTVAELAEIFKPLPPPTRAVGAARKDRESKKRKVSAGNGEENGEKGAKKKRKKKTVNPDDPTAEGQAPMSKQLPPSQSEKQGDTAQVAANFEDDTILNLSPTEAARRRDEATRKLSENGVDPATLSQEQFDIFANQSPELQNESLAMLIKYGAERLRIVHPNKDNASSSPAQANVGLADSSEKKKKSRRKEFNEDGTPRAKKTRGSCQACKAKKTKCSKTKPECNKCVEAGIECYYPPQQKRKSNKQENEIQEDAPEGQTIASQAAITEPVAAAADAIEPVAIPEPEPVALPRPEPEAAPEEEASDLGSPGFNSSNPAPSSIIPQQADTSTFQEPSHDLYQPTTGGLSYPEAESDGMAAGMDYSAYSNQLGQQQATQSGMAYPQQSQQMPTVSYPDQLGAPVPEPVQATQTTAHSTRPKPSRPGARHSLPPGTSQSQAGYSNSATPSNGSAWQAANAPASATRAYSTSSSSPRQSGARGQTAAPLPPRVYDASQQEALAAATTLSQAALQRTKPSPTTRTVSPFQNATKAATQGARAKSRQGQKAQSRTKASAFQQASSTLPAPIDTAAIYGQSSASTEPSNLPNYDQYPRHNMATTQSDQTSPRGGYDSYSQQTNSNNLSASYSGYDAHNARSQSSSTTPLAAPVTQGISASYTRTAAPGAGSWSNSTAHRNTSSYSANNTAVTAKSTYNAPASSTQQQQPANMQAYNIRPPSTAHASRTSTPSYNAQQQRTQLLRQPQPQQPQQQQQQQQHPPYNTYSAQSHTSSGQPPGQQPQQDWYGFGSGNGTTSGYGSNSRADDYAQSSQHRPAAMNISGNTYQSMGDQDLFEIFRGHAAH